MRTVDLAVAHALGAAVVSRDVVRGGDIHEAYRMALADGREVFVKTSRSATRAVFEAEAHGLGWLAGAHALRTPEVLAVTDDPAALVLAWIEPGRASRAGEEALGVGLAALHRASPGVFGLDRQGELAGIRWDNSPSHDWPSFFAERRLLPMLARAEKSGRVTARIRSGVERVAASIASRVGPPEPPARLHGDLWSGNVIWDRAGQPVLVDPAVYGGHREIDLAMMRLFGGFSQRTFDAYESAYPLSPGHERRVPLYQLLPLLAHVALFGGGYVGGVERALDALGA